MNLAPYLSPRLPTEDAIRQLVNARTGQAFLSWRILLLDQNRAQAVFGEHNFIFTGEMRYLLGRMTGRAGAGGE